MLGTERFGPEDTFFDAGGHSLLMARLGDLIEQRLDAKVSNIDLFQYPTIRSLARYLSQANNTTDKLASDMARRVAMRKRRSSAARPRTKPDEE